MASPNNHFGTAEHEIEGARGIFHMYIMYINKTFWKYSQK